MKAIVTTLLLICSGNVLIAQKTEKTIVIKDFRSWGAASNDTLTRGYHSGEVYVHRIQLTNDPKETGYTIHFFRPCKNHLNNYHINLIQSADFDKVSYSWVADSIVSVTFINSSTNKKGKLRLIQLPEKGLNSSILPEDTTRGMKFYPNEEGDCSAGFIKESSDDFFDEK